MGIEISLDKKSNYKLPERQTAFVSYNTKVAIWHLPYDKRYSSYDRDDSKWFETINEFGKNEVESAEKGLNTSFNKFKVHTRTTTFSDNTQETIIKYPNGTQSKEYQGDNYVFAKVKDKFGRLVAEKIYNYESNEGRKILYEHHKQDDNTFTIVRIFKYDTSKNRKTDIVNFGYTNLPSTLTKGCELVKVYYMLNGEEVKDVKKDDYKYCVKDKNGKKLKFTID